MIYLILAYISLYIIITSGEQALLIYASFGQILPHWLITQFNDQGITHWINLVSFILYWLILCQYIYKWWVPATWKLEQLTLIWLVGVVSLVPIICFITEILGLDPLLDYWTSQYYNLSCFNWLPSLDTYITGRCQQMVLLCLVNIICIIQPACIILWAVLTSVYWPLGLYVILWGFTRLLQQYLLFLIKTKLN